jgi:hypothetical protein
MSNTRLRPVHLRPSTGVTRPLTFFIPITVCLRDQTRMRFKNYRRATSEGEIADHNRRQPCQFLRSEHRVQEGWDNPHDTTSTERANIAGSTNDGWIYDAAKHPGVAVEGSNATHGIAGVRRIVQLQNFIRQIELSREGNQKWHSYRSRSTNALVLFRV